MSSSRDFNFPRPRPAKVGAARRLVDTLIPTLLAIATQSPRDLVALKVLAEWKRDELLGHPDQQRRRA